MARLYLAGPLFDLQDREFLERLAKSLEQADHQTFLPHRDGGDDAATRGPEDDAEAEKRRREVFQADLEGLRRSDGVLALLDGPDVDAGTAFELGWAYAQGRPIMGLRTDFRTLGPEGPVSLMVYAACRPFLHAHDLSWSVIEKKILDWAQDVNPWGGRLVRDGVPQILKRRDVDMRFRRLDPQEVPRALKAKVHELARDLEAAKVDEEAEGLADLLQATEALIQKRGWDRSTLRNLKQKRWKERGGYEEGWVVEDAGVKTAQEKTQAQ